MDENFLLSNKTAKRLYTNYAKDMPIFDFHCHLSAKEIAENKQFKNITEAWLSGDHYKWRAMRSNGVTEDYITGNKSHKEKFVKWAETITYAIGNPLYHWTHLELKRYFNIKETINNRTIENIWDKCNKAIAGESFKSRELIKRSNVKGLCTTDDPTDTLEYHIKIAKDDSFNVKVLPSFRPDKGINIEKEDFNEWINKLSEVVEYKIDSINKLFKALEERIDFFHQVGCRVSDHGIETNFFINKEIDEEIIQEANEIFICKIENKILTEEQIVKYKAVLFSFFGKEYAKRKWIMQLHIGAIRNNNSKMLKKLGPDSGFDSISDFNYGEQLSRYLDTLDSTNKLPKTILYCLNPRDNYLLGSMLGNFQGHGIPGKIQFGTAWWFNDNKCGMEEQMKALANLGLLSKFVGMLTDSRSFLSYTRHEYFRRILSNLVGEWVENGEFPDDFDVLGEVIEGICFNNAVKYFGIDL
jgi:glucuronate isomerase